MNYIEYRHVIASLHAEYVAKRNAVTAAYLAEDKAQAKIDRVNKARAHQSAQAYLTVWGQYLTTRGAWLGGTGLGAPGPGIALACELDPRFAYDKDCHKVTRVV